MVAPVRTTPVFDHNNVITQGSGETLQSQEEVFRLHQLLLGLVGVDENNVASSAGAWTLIANSDSVSLSGEDGSPATNLLLAPANFVFAAPGVAHTWAIYKAPDGLVAAGKELYMGIDCVSTNRGLVQTSYSIEPNTAQGGTDGTLTNRPIGLAPRENINFNTTWHGTAGDVDRDTHGWRNEVGEFCFIASQRGTGFPETMMWVVRPDNGEADIDYPVGLYYGHSTNALNKGAGGYANLEGSNQWDGFWQDDSIITAAILIRALYGNASTSNWPDGKSTVSSGYVDGFIDMNWNSVTESAYAGRIVDMRSSAENIVNGSDQSPGDTGLVRRVAIGELWWLYRAAGGVPLL